MLDFALSKTAGDYSDWCCRGAHSVGPTSGSPQLGGLQLSCGASAVSAAGLVWLCKCTSTFFSLNLK